MLFSQFMVAAVSIFVTPFTIMAVALVVEWFHGPVLQKETFNNESANAEA